MTPHHTEQHISTRASQALARLVAPRAQARRGAHLRRARIAKCEPRVAELGARGLESRRSEARKRGGAACERGERSGLGARRHFGKRRLPGSCFRPHKFLHQKKTIATRKFEAGQEVRRGWGGP